MANAEKLVRSLLGKAFKMPQTEIDTLLDDQTTDEDGIKLLTERDQTRIVEIKKEKVGKSYADGIKKGKEEAITELETTLKEEFELESEATGVDLVKEIVTTKAPPSKLTEDEVRKSKVYIDAEKAHKKALKDKETELTTQLETERKNFKKDQTFGTVSTKALELLNGLNPVISSNATVAANLQKAFLATFKDYEFEEQEGGGIVVMKDGKVVQDGHGQNVDFDELVKGRAAEYYEFKANNGGANGGGGDGKDNKKGDNGKNPAYPANIVKPKNMEEYSKIVSDTSIPVADRRIVADTWDREHAQGSE